MKIKPKAPWFQSPDFSNATKDVEIISSLGTCEGCVHLEITKGTEFSAIQCLQPERVKQGLGTSTKHACRYRQVAPLYDYWICKPCGTTYLEDEAPVRGGIHHCELCGRPLDRLKPKTRTRWVCTTCNRHREPDPDKIEMRCPVCGDLLHQGVSV